MIAAGGQHRFPAGRKGSPGDHVGVAPHPADFKPGDAIPQAHGKINAGRQNGVSVGRKGDGPDRVAMPGELAQLLASGRVP
jgi:hypothetical protein